MQLPANLQGESLKRLLQGAAAGAIATVIIVFSGGVSGQPTQNEIAWFIWGISDDVVRDGVRNAGLL